MDGLFSKIRSLSASGAINIGTARRCFKGLGKKFSSLPEKFCADLPVRSSAVFRLAENARLRSAGCPI